MINYITSPIYLLQDASMSLSHRPLAAIAATGKHAPIRPAYGNAALDAFVPELMIALLQYCLPIETEDDWGDLIDNPPDQDSLQALFAKKAVGFSLYGDAPAFQDITAEHAEPSSVARLLPMLPGEQTRKFNQDIHFPEVTAMRVEVAMVALAMVQAYSPAGGRGTRTSLTGGGPLRTLVDGETLRSRLPDHGPLYRTVLANLMPRNDFEALGAKRSGLPELPWQDPAACRSGKRVSTNAPAAHLYFACPRRILLPEPEPPTPDGRCDITGESNVPLIRTIQQTADGPDYDSVGWRHPLTPYVYRKDKGTIRPFPRLAATLPPDATWRDRLGLFVPSTGAMAGEGPVPAELVRRWRDGRARRQGCRSVVLRAFGLRCDNARILGLVDRPFAFYTPPADPAARTVFEQRVVRLVTAAESMVRALRSAIRDALRQKTGVGTDKSPVQCPPEAEIAFWAQTESSALDYLRTTTDRLTVPQSLDDPAVTNAIDTDENSCLATAVAVARDLFDTFAPDPLTCASPKSVVEARARLVNSLTAARDPDRTKKQRSGKKGGSKASLKTAQERTPA